MIRSTQSRLNQALDGARLVRFDDTSSRVAVWQGGVTINIYNSRTFDELTCFSLSDELGEPCSRDEVDEHIGDIFERNNDEY